MHRRPERGQPRARHVRPLPLLFNFDTSLKTLVEKRHSPTTAESLNWLKAVAHGGCIDSEGKRWKMKPGIRQALRVQIAPSFVFNHPRLYQALRSAMRAHGSKWVASRDYAGGVRIAGKTDFTAFLLGAQCATES